MQFEIYRCTYSCFFGFGSMYVQIYICPWYFRTTRCNLKYTGAQTPFFFGLYAHKYVHLSLILSHAICNVQVHELLLFLFLLYVYKYVYISLMLSHDEIQFKMCRCTNSYCLCCGIYVVTHICFWYFRATKRNLKYTGARTPVFWFCCKYIYLFLILARDDNSFIRATWRIHSFRISPDQGNFSRAFALVFFSMLMRVVWHTSMRHVARANECVMSQCVGASRDVYDAVMRTRDMSHYTCISTYTSLDTLISCRSYTCVNVPIHYTRVWMCVCITLVSPDTRL